MTVRDIGAKSDYRIRWDMVAANLILSNPMRSWCTPCVKIFDRSAGIWPAGSQRYMREPSLGHSRSQLASMSSSLRTLLALALSLALGLTAITLLLALVWGL